MFGAIAQANRARPQLDREALRVVRRGPSKLLLMPAVGRRSMTVPRPSMLRMPAVGRRMVLLGIIARRKLLSRPESAHAQLMFQLQDSWLRPGELSWSQPTVLLQSNVQLLSLVQGQLDVGLQDNELQGLELMVASAPGPGVHCLVRTYGALRQEVSSPHSQMLEQRVAPTNAPPHERSVERRALVRWSIWWG